jgi:hypothetical protein
MPQRIDPTSAIAIARPICWDVISEALMDPDITPAVLLEQVKEYSGDMWDKCNEFFADLITQLFPQNFNYNVSYNKFVKELAACTGMKYSKVCAITIVCFPIDIIVVNVSSNILRKPYESLH